MSYRLHIVREGDARAAEPPGAIGGCGNCCHINLSLYGVHYSACNATAQWCRDVQERLAGDPCPHWELSLPQCPRPPRRSLARWLWDVLFHWDTKNNEES